MPLAAETMLATTFRTAAVTTQQPGFVPEEHLVVFTLDQECYGVDIGQVWEINEVQEITRVPRAPHFIEGVINLRGQITPVMDLRRRLGLPPRQHDRATRIMVVQVNDNRLGMIVDGVREVIKVPGDAIEPLSQLVTTAHSTYLRAIAKLDERLIILFDLERLLSEREETALTHMEQSERYFPAEEERG